MAFLTLGGVTVPVLIEGPDSEAVEVGAVEASFDGTPRSSVRAYKDRWEISTKWMTVAAADTLEAALKGTPPVAATGTLTGTISVLITGIRRTDRKFAGGEYRRLTFTMLEQ
ncbi:MAG: hypothetical protein AMXMBFR53_36350 [Gemmatimonadota bacterium]